MPTAYTEAIADDITFEQFAFRCAHTQLGLFLEGQSLSNEIPRAFTPGSYHLDELNTYQKEYERLMSLSEEEEDAAALDDYQNKVNERDLALETRESLYRKYIRMLDRIENWEPPSDAHLYLKSFMQSQIRDSIRQDCQHTIAPIVRLTGQEWCEKELKRVKDLINYHQREYEKELLYTETTNEWVEQLFISLGFPPSDNS